MRSAVVVLLTLLGVAPPGASLAATLSVSPVRVTMGTGGQPQVIRLQNLGDAGTLVQVEIFRWRTGTDLGELEPTRDLLAVPPIFEVGPQSSQIIRLALRQPLELDREASYRLLITEVPREASVAPQTIAFALQLNMPVFVTPDGAKPDPAWSIRRTSSGATELVLANRGSSHLRVKTIGLLAERGDAPVAAIDQAAYVLAGQEKSWPLELPARVGKELTVRAETNLGELEAKVALPGG